MVGCQHKTAVAPNRRLHNQYTVAAARSGWWKCNVDAKFHDESGRMGCEIPYLRVSFTYELQKGCIRRLSHKNSIIETSYIKVTDIIGVKLHKT
jgi:hypothetical protein